MQKFNVETVVMSNFQDITDYNILVTVMLCVNIQYPPYCAFWWT